MEGADVDRPPSVAKARDQLQTLIWKHALLKRRAPKSFLCELMSPALFICILVLGYYLADISYKKGKEYVTLDLDITPIAQASASRVGHPQAKVD